MSKILFIVPMPFHDNSDNAGAKVVNYYIKKFSKDYDVSVLLYYAQNDVDVRQMLKECPKTKFITCFDKKSLINRFIDGIIKYNFLFKVLFKFNPIYYRTNSVIKKRLAKLLRLIEQPASYDSVIVEFPPLVLQSDIIKKFFPFAKICASVHDVSFQSLQRSNNIHKIWISKKRFVQKFKEFELLHLKNFDLLVVLCDKDKALIEHEFISTPNILTISPYYDIYNYIENKPDGIFFFGAMDRKDNTNSLMWFLKNIWQFVVESSGSNLKFYIVGSGVSEEFRKYCNQYNNLIITGFVENPISFFNKCYAMVVPLQYGAGIKIKSIEALASGIPLISNQIGIEGIPALKGRDYIHCETPEEWIRSIKLIVDNESIRNRLNVNSKKFVISYFNLEESYEKYKSKLMTLSM